MHDFAQLLGFPFAPLNDEQLAATEGQLGLKFVDSYRQLLRSSNGGIVTGERKNFRVCFDLLPEDLAANSGELGDDDDGGLFVGEVDEDHGHYIWDSLFELFGIGVPRLLPGPLPQPASLLDENDAFRLERFLPRHVIGIGRAQSQSLICLSLGPDDAGAVYYWYHYWHYPWAKAYFDRRAAAVEAAFPDHAAIMRRQRGEDYEALMDAVNYAMMVKLSATLDDFLAQLTERAPRCG